MPRAKSGLPPPFLKEVRLREERLGEGYPFDLPILRERPWEIRFTRPITFFVGENGTGKSTLIEAIAQHCGFNLGGGGGYAYESHTPSQPLADALRLAWLPKVTNGYFLRAESFFNVASFLEEVAHYASDPWGIYGGKPLHQLSHGQALLALFKGRLGSRRRSFYILDEPEAALSPTRQLAFLALLRRWELSGMAQFIVATHSPVLLAYPGATLISLDGGRLHEVRFKDTEHYRVTRDFLVDPDTHLAEIFERADHPLDDDEDCDD
jgi:predicted ATPase